MPSNTLSPKEILYFYDLLLRYEYESYTGYQDKEVFKKVGGKIIFDDKHVQGENITQETDECFRFVPFGQTICGAILYHIRNSFAHGNLQSIENDTKFLIKDYSDKKKRRKCNMLGKISKIELYALVDIMNKTRKKSNKKTSL